MYMMMLITIICYAKEQIKEGAMKLDDKSLEAILLENAKELEIDSTKLIAYENKDIFIIKKATRKKVEDLYMSSHRMAEFRYVKEFDKYIAMVKPIEDADAEMISIDEPEEHAVVAIISRNHKVDELLLDFVNGFGNLHFAVISTELDTISVRKFLSDSTGRLLIGKQIKYAQETSSNNGIVEEYDEINTHRD